MAELKAHLEAVRQSQKADEDAEIVRSIRSMNVKGWDLLRLLDSIQNGTVWSCGRWNLPALPMRSMRGIHPKSCRISMEKKPALTSRRRTRRRKVRNETMKKKKLLTLLTTLCMALTLFPVTAFAYAEPEPTPTPEPVIEETTPEGTPFSVPGNGGNPGRYYR